jgi:predicted DNA-binding transcriptional regulator AlpA
LSDDNLDEAGAAEKLGVSTGTLANWRWRGYGPPFLKIGRRVEYRVSDIEAWRDEQLRQPSTSHA